jgi:hypothetical protein
MFATPFRFGLVNPPNQTPTAAVVYLVYLSSGLFTPSQSFEFKNEIAGIEGNVNSTSAFCSKQCRPKAADRATMGKIFMDDGC